MISLKTIKDKQVIKKYYNKKRLIYTDNSQCLTATCNGEVLGFCLFDMTEKSGIIRYIEPENDISLYDGILRSTLHVMAERSIMNVFYDEMVSETILSKLLFIKDKKRKTLDIDKLFKGCCCNKN